MVENKDQRKGWLRELKMGDDVFIVASRGVLGKSVELRKIEKITPTGRINAGGKQFPPTGVVRESFYNVELTQATPEKITQYYENRRKNRLIQSLNATIKETDFNKFSVEEIQNMINYLKGEDNGN